MATTSTRERCLVAAAAGAAGVAFCLYRRLAKRVAECEARAQIAEYAAYYTRGIDRLDPAMVRRPFTADAMIDVPNLPAPVPVGEFAVGATNFLGKTLVATQHCVSNAVVHFPAPGAAVSEIYFIAHHWKLVDGEIRNAGVNGRYLDTWTRGADGVYRICKRKLLYDFQGTLWNDAVKAAADTPDDLVQAPSVARPENLGRRDKDDYSYVHLHGL